MNSRSSKRRSFARASIRRHHAHELLALLMTGGPEQFATSEDQAEWGAIVQGVPRWQALVEAAHEADSERVWQRLAEHRPLRASGHLPPWVDRTTTARLRTLVVRVAAFYPAASAVLLYGSVARPTHTERPLSDPEPSDVDLLILYRVPQEPGALAALAVSMASTLPATSVAREEVPTDAVGQLLPSSRIGTPSGASGQTELSPTFRTIQVLILSESLDEVSGVFVETIREDALLLWCRHAPPPMFAMQK